MELRHLRYFVAVAEALSFTRAASRLRVSQSSLSVQVARLEDEIGAPLLAREGRGVALTPAGAAFLEHARRLLALAEDAIAAARRAAGGSAGILAIGHNTAAEFAIFPAVVPGFTRAWPGIHLKFRNLRTTQQIDALRRGQLDVAFGWLPLPTDEFEVAAVRREPLAAVLPAAHPLAAADRVRVADLARESFITFSRALDPASALELELLFHHAGVEMTVAHETDTMLSTLNFIAMGCGYSILPDFTRHLRSGAIAYRPLDPPVVKTLAMVTRRGEGGAARLFAAYVRDHAADRAPHPGALLLA